MVDRNPFISGWVWWHTPVITALGRWSGGRGVGQGSRCQPGLHRQSEASHRHLLRCSWSSVLVHPHGLATSITNQNLRPLQPLPSVVPSFPPCVFQDLTKILLSESSWGPLEPCCPGLILLLCCPAKYTHTMVSSPTPHSVRSGFSLPLGLLSK